MYICIAIKLKTYFQCNAEYKTLNVYVAINSKNKHVRSVTQNIKLF